MVFATQWQLDAHVAVDFYMNNMTGNLLTQGDAVIGWKTTYCGFEHRLVLDLMILSANLC